MFCVLLSLATLLGFEPETGASQPRPGKSPDQKNAGAATRLGGKPKRTRPNQSRVRDAGSKSATVEVVDERWQTDSRKNYQIKGEVGYVPGSVTLGPASSLTRMLPCGPVARLLLEFDPRADAPREMQVVLAPAPIESFGWDNIAAGKPVTVTVRHVPAQDGRRTLIVSIEAATRPGIGSDWSAPKELKRTFTAELAKPIASLEIDYRYGVVHVSAIGLSNCYGCANNGSAALKSISVRQIEGSCRLNRLQIAGSPTAPLPSWGQRLRLLNAARQDFQNSRLMSQGRYQEAEPHGRSTYATCREILGDDHEYSLNALASLTLNLAMQGKLIEAEQLQRDCLERVRELLGDRHPQTALAYGRLAFSLDELGRHTAAHPLHLKSLELRRILHGENDTQTAYGYRGLARNLMNQGKYIDAERWYRNALSIQRAVEGEVHPATATIISDLAQSLEKQGKHGAALPLFQQALETFRSKLGERHPATATGYNNLAACLATQSKFAEAQPLYQKALAIHRAVLGETHPTTAIGHNNLAANLLEQGNYAEAEASARTALTIQLKVFGAEHPDTAQSYSNLAMHLKAQGKNVEALECLRIAVSIDRKILGQDHPQTATSYNNLAANLNDQGKHAEAEEYARTSLNVRIRTLGAEHPETAVAYHNLASSLLDQEKHAEAEECNRKALAIHQKVFGEDHPSTAVSLGAAADSLFRQGKYAEAESLFQRALAIDLKFYGEHHLHTATSYHNLASNLNNLGRHRDAEELCRKALTSCRGALGEEHQRTVAAYHSVAHNLNCQGRFAEAEQIWTTAADRFAVARLRLAASGLERVERSGDDSPLAGLAAVLARNGKPAAAWQRFEECLGRGQWDDLSSRLRRTAQEQARQNELVARLDRLDKLIEVAASNQHSDREQATRRAELLAEQRRTLEELSAYARLLEQKHGPVAGKAFDRQTIQASLSADAALVGWLDLAGMPKAADPQGDHWAFLLRSSGDPFVVKLTGAEPKHGWTESDTSLPAELRAALQSPRGDWRGLADRLRRQRLAPLEPYLAAGNGLPAVRHLIVLTSSAFAGIPVETITNNYLVSYAHSGTLYAHQRRSAAANAEGLLALADPDFERAKRESKPAPAPKGGVLLTAVTPGGNAARTDLRAGDVLLRYAGAELFGPADLDRRIANQSMDQRVPVRVWREGKELDLIVSPGKLAVVVAIDPAPKALLEIRKADLRLAGRGSEEENWAPLPGTRVEVETLRRLVRGADASWRLRELLILADSDASEQQLYQLAKSGALGKFRYLHLATHGTIDDRYPLRSALILARDQLPDPGKQLASGLPVFDGSLTAEEVLRNWRLNTELVTLSACQSGLGRYQHGEGFVGFAQALMLAGSRSVCLSLWKVDDAATALFMARFYENLLGARAGLQGPMRKAEALADAKVWLRNLTRQESRDHYARQSAGVTRGKGRPLLPLANEPLSNGNRQDRPFAHPYYWAAFVLIGDPR